MNNITIPEIIDNQIKYHSKGRPRFKDFLNRKPVNGTVEMLKIVVENERGTNQELMITNFIRGLALFYDHAIKKKPLDPMINKLTSPVLELISSAVQSDRYRYDIIDEEITGEETLCVDGVTSPMTNKEILRQIRRDKAIPLTQKDIPPIIQAWLKYKKSLHTQPLENVSELKPEGPHLSLPVIALICCYTGQAIDNTSGKQILQRYNPELKSVRKLIEKYNLYQSTVNRTNLSDSKKTDNHKKNLLEKVVTYLEANNLEAGQAKQELNKLSDLIMSKY